MAAEIIEIRPRSSLPSSSALKSKPRQFVRPSRKSESVRQAQESGNSSSSYKKPPSQIPNVLLPRDNSFHKKTTHTFYRVVANGHDLRDDRDESRLPQRREDYPRDYQECQDTTARRNSRNDPYDDEEGGTYKEDYDLQDGRGSTSHQARRDPLSTALDTERFDQDLTNRSTQEASAWPPALEDSDTLKDGRMHIEDAFIWYFVLKYDYLEPAQFGILWNFYIATKNLGMPLHPGNYDWIYHRCYFLHRQAYIEVKKSAKPDLSDKELNHAAVEKLNQACQVTSVGSEWTNSNIVREDMQHVPGMKFIRYHGKKFFPILTKHEGLAKRLRIESI
ncbi:hypothetical protein MMC11_004991 [Xylographa trunciseda]|nr:hypothetical protein [Xylographa trunciseda]